METLSFSSAVSAWLANLVNQGHILPTHPTGALAPPIICKGICKVGRRREASPCLPRAAPAHLTNGSLTLKLGPPSS